MPILIALAIAFLLLAVAALRRQISRDPLMGAPRTPLSRTPPPARAAPVPPTRPVSPSEPEPPEDLVARVMPLIAKGEKINAIKLVRDATGMGLKQAKDYVESLE